MIKNFLISVLLILGGTAVFVFGSPYYKVFPTNGNQMFVLALTTFFLAATLFLKRTPSLEAYWPAAFSLFVASAALLFMGTGVINLQRSTMAPMQFVAMDKLSQFLYIVPIIIVLTLLMQGDLKSIFINWGKVKQGLIFGLVSFVSFALIAFMMNLKSPNFFATLKPTIPWILLFVIANAIMEELWFRGIFLKNYESIVGKTAAILVTSLVFGLSHVNATYEFPGGGLVFGLVVFCLALVGAYTMFKQDSLIGPVLFHAGYDLLIIIPVLNSL